MALPTVAPRICRLPCFLEEPLCRLEGQRLEVWVRTCFMTWGSGAGVGGGSSQQGCPEGLSPPARTLSPGTPRGLASPAAAPEDQGGLLQGWGVGWPCGGPFKLLSGQGEWGSVLKAGWSTGAGEQSPCAGESAGQAGSRWQSLVLGTALGTTHAQQAFALQLSAATRWGAGRGQEQPALHPPSSAPPTHAESELQGEVVSQVGEAAPLWPGSAPAGGWGLIL